MRPRRWNRADVSARHERDLRVEEAAEIDAWIDQVGQTWNVLSVDGRTFRLWAKLMHRRPDELLADAVIAATAVVHKLVVVTRNVEDFKVLGVETLGPFDSAR